MTSCIRVNSLQADVPAVIAALRSTFSDQSQNATADLPPDSIREHPELPGVIEIRGSGPHVVDYSPRSSELKTDKGKRQEEAGGVSDGIGDGEVEVGGGSRRDGVGMERGELKEVLVSRKCGEAVLRGAQVRASQLSVPTHLNTATIQIFHMRHTFHHYSHTVSSGNRYAADLLL